MRHLQFHSYEGRTPLLTFPPSRVLQHDGKPYCHKPCYAALFGPKGADSSCLQCATAPYRSFSGLLAQHLCLCSGVNIGGAGSYVYDNPVNEAPAAVSMETDGKPEEEKKAPARGPVKGEKYAE